VALIEKVADRMLSLVAPKLTAGACCLSYGKHVTHYCYGDRCTDCYIYKQNCVINCFCEIICGACYKAVACC
jgi:hypothetical protein